MPEGTEWFTLLCVVLYRLQLRGESYHCQGVPVKRTTEDGELKDGELTQLAVVFQKDGSIFLYRNGALMNKIGCRKHHQPYKHAQIVFGATVLCDQCEPHWPLNGSPCSQASVESAFEGGTRCNNGITASVACARFYRTAVSKSDMKILYRQGPCTAVISKMDWLTLKQPFKGLEPKQCGAESAEGALTCTSNDEVKFVVHKPRFQELDVLFRPPEFTFHGCNVPVRYIEGDDNAVVLRHARNVIWDLNELSVVGGPPRLKPKGQVWIGITKENEGMHPQLERVLQNKSVWRMDYIASYKTSSDFPITHISHIYMEHTDGQSFRNPVPPPEHRKKKMLCLYNNCNRTPSNRPHLISALTNVFPIDSRGNCLRNKGPLQEDGNVTYKYKRAHNLGKVLSSMQSHCYTNRTCG